MSYEDDESRFFIGMGYLIAAAVIVLILAAGAALHVLGVPVPFGD